MSVSQFHEDPDRVVPINGCLGEERVTIDFCFSLIVGKF